MGEIGETVLCLPAADFYIMRKNNNQQEEAQVMKEAAEQAFFKTRSFVVRAKVEPQYGESTGDPASRIRFFATRVYEPSV